MKSVSDTIVERPNMNDGEIETFYAYLDEKTPLQVRHLLATGRFNSEKKRLAEHWIGQRDREESISASREANALTRAQASAQRSAADSSRTLAEEAKEANRLAREANDKAATANTIATVALAIAVIAISVSVIGLFLS